MTLQPLERLIHPLESLIQKHGENRTRAHVGRSMAEISFSLETSKPRVNPDELGYKKEFKARAKYYEGYLSKYLAGTSKPEIGMLLLMSRAIGCDLEELTEIFYPEHYFDGYSAKPKDQEVTRTRSYTSFLSYMQEADILPEFDFKILEVQIQVFYLKGSPNTLRWTKTFKLQSLKDNLRILEKFDYYKCVRDKPDVEFSYSGEALKIRREKALDSDDNVISVIFDKPLKKGQEVEFNLSFFCSEVIDRDIEFHYTWIIHPTDKLVMEVVPPDPENNRQAKYYVHVYKGCPLGIERVIESADMFLDAESSSYKIEIDHPRLYNTYGFYWGRQYW